MKFSLVMQPGNYRVQLRGENDEENRILDALYLRTKYLEIVEARTENQYPVLKTSFIGVDLVEWHKEAEDEAQGT